MSAVKLSRPGVRTNYRVRRHLRLARHASSLQCAVVRQQAEALLGFDRFRVNADKICFEYDAGHLQLDSLISLFDRHQLLLDSRWQRFKRGWYRYQDANIRDVSRDASSSCCSQSPLRYR